MTATTPLTLTLPDMTCGHCQKAVTAALQADEPDCALEFDLPQHTVRISSRRSEAQLRAVLQQADYPPA